MPRFYTKTGDAGTSGIFGGKRLRKSEEIFSAMGALDELNAILGIARATAKNQKLNAEILKLQDMLFRAGADISTPKGTKTAASRISGDDLEKLEARIDRIARTLPRLGKFVIPGNTPAGAWLNFSRAAARRAERTLIAAYEKKQVANKKLLPWMNRLSSLLFVLALREDFKQQRRLKHPTYQT